MTFFFIIIAIGWIITFIGTAILSVHWDDHEKLGAFIASTVFGWCWPILLLGCGLLFIFWTIQELVEMLKELGIKGFNS